MSDANKLKQIILEEIALKGPMALSTYMRFCLTHPQFGYYKTRDPLGAQGDFITAPEISQMFGEMIGVWIITAWENLGRPTKVTIGELGPGRGTLMHDALRVVQKLPELHDNARIVLLETNPELRALQQEKLHQFTPRFITEIEEFNAFDAPLILIANEFFDALPIRQYQKQNGAWHERLIGERNGDLAWGLSTTPIDEKALPASLFGAQDGEIFEDAPLAADTMDAISAVLKQLGGALLAIDYGYTQTQAGDTFQALQNHKSVSPLADPGSADLTAHVNFQALIEAAEACGIQGHMVGTQTELLDQLGIRERAQTLIAANPERKLSIEQDLNRLIGLTEMGELFKAMIVHAPIPTNAEKSIPRATTPQLSGKTSIAHGFFGRQGGVSPAPYEGLNTSYSNDDAPENVDANRARIASMLGFEPAKFATVTQVHGNRVIVVDDSFDIQSRPDADGLVTRERGVLLGIMTADCTPILFADTPNGIIGACHAGWQGAVEGIIDQTIKQMLTLGANAQNIIASIGPNIGFENYEVGPDFAKNVGEKHPEAKPHIRIPEGKNREHFDLTEFVRNRLEASKIQQVELVGHCTYADPTRYYSHRYATHQKIEMGRQISVIGLT